MKKWTSLLLALAMALSLAACGNSNQDPPGASGICQRLDSRRNAHRRTGRGAVGGTCRE